MTPEEFRRALQDHGIELTDSQMTHLRFIMKIWWPPTNTLI